MLFVAGTWTAFHGAVATHVLADLVPLVEPVMARFREHKRAAALLDFDDLIFAARDLLRDRDEVRRALAKRFRQVLVDEFQDTDPLQTEIFWRLCGEPPARMGTADDWTAFTLRAGRALPRGRSQAGHLSLPRRGHCGLRAGA